MAEAAYPSETDQGRFGTCPVASMETRTWFDRPSVAASIIADQALTGQWVAPDGHVVKLPPQDYVTDKFSQETNTLDGQRSFAGQLFQATALSDLGSRYDTPKYYATDGIVKNDNDNGKGTGINYWSDENGKKIEDYQGLADGPVAEELRRLDGANTEVLTSEASESGANRNIVVFVGKEDFKAKLQEAQEGGKMPIVITVAGGDKFFGQKINSHALNHDICIDKYDPKTGGLVIDNQWGAKYDWGTKSVLGSPSDKNTATNVDDFYPATQGDDAANNSLRL
jgi:hypothetical protein